MRYYLVATPMLQMKIYKGYIVPLAAIQLILVLIPDMILTADPILIYRYTVEIYLPKGWVRPTLVTCVQQYLIVSHRSPSSSHLPISQLVMETFTLRHRHHFPPLSSTRPSPRPTSRRRRSSCTFWQQAKVASPRLGFIHPSGFLAVFKLELLLLGLLAFYRFLWHADMATSFILDMLDFTHVMIWLLLLNGVVLRDVR